MTNEHSMNLGRGKNRVPWEVERAEHIRRAEAVVAAHEKAAQKTDGRLSEAQHAKDDRYNRWRKEQRRKREMEDEHRIWCEERRQRLGPEIVAEAEFHTMLAEARSGAWTPEIEKERRRQKEAAEWERKEWEKAEKRGWYVNTLGTCAFFYLVVVHTAAALFLILSVIAPGPDMDTGQFQIQVAVVWFAATLFGMVVRIFPGRTKINPGSAQ